MDAAYVRRLENRIAALERQAGAYRGPGTSRIFDADRVRPTQVGFAAQLTGPYDTTNTPSTGYPWKRRLLDATVPGLTDPGVQPTGKQAFSVDGSTALGAGTDVWLEPSPDGTGWLFNPPKSTPYSTHQVLGGSDGASFGEGAPAGAGWTGLLCRISLAPGTWRVRATATAYGQTFSTVGTNALGEVWARVWDETNAVQVGGTAAVTSLWTGPTFPTTFLQRVSVGTAAWSWEYAVTAPAVLVLQGQVPANTVFYNGFFVYTPGGGAAGTTMIEAEQVV